MKFSDRTLCRFVTYEKLDCAICDATDDIDRFDWTGNFSFNIYECSKLYFIIESTFRNGIFKLESQRLIQMLNEANSLMLSAQQLSNATTQTSSHSPAELMAKAQQIQFITILIVHRLVKQDAEGNWMMGQSQLVDSLLRIWSDKRFIEKHRNIDQLDLVYWKEPVYLAKIFLKFHKVCHLFFVPNQKIS